MSISSNIHSISGQKALMVFGIAAAMYCGLAKLGLILASSNGIASPVWPAMGLALATTITFGSVFGFAIGLGSFVANALFTPASPAVAIEIAFGTAIAAVFGGLIYRKISGGRGNLYYLKHNFALILAAAVAGVIAAALGTISIFLSQSLTLEKLTSVFVTWFVGDALGALFVTLPMLVLCERLQGKKSVDSTSILRRLIVLAVLAIVTALVATNAATNPVFLYVAFPAMLLIVMTVDGNWQVFAPSVIAAIYIIGTYYGRGPFLHGTSTDKLINLQLFLASFGLTALGLQSFKQTVPLKIPATVCLLGWILSATALHSFVKAEMQSDAKHFASMVQDAEEAIKVRMASYIDALNAGAAFFASDDEVTPLDWKEFTHELAVDRRYPGINGIGYIARVQPDDLKKFTAQETQLYEGNFKIKSVPNVESPQRPEYYVITRIEPLDPNRNAVGLDVSSEKTRLAGALLARDTGLPAMTGVINLVQDNKTRPGFLLYLPVYKKGYPAIAANFAGFIYAPFVAENFFKGVLGSRAKEFQVSIYAENKLLFQSSDYSPLTDSSLWHLEKKSTTALAQLPLNFQWTPTSAFTTSHDTTASWVACLGALVTLLVSSITVDILSLRRRAEALAATMHQELQKARDENEQQRIKSFNSAKMSTLGEMAGGIAHEINNPLAIISGKARSLQRGIKSGSITAEEAVEQTQKIITTIDRVAAIIRGLKSFSRQGDNDPFSPTEIRSIINDTLVLCQERFKNHGIDLTFEPGPTVMAECRSVEISQVILNLLTNAFDAMEHLETKWVKIAVLDLGGDVSIQVTDSGHGIPAAIKEKIMQPFFSTKEVGKGTGLGLSISSGILQSHGGRLVLDDKNGHTTFIVTWPKLQKKGMVS